MVMELPRDEMALVERTVTSMSTSGASLSGLQRRSIAALSRTMTAQQTLSAPDREPMSDLVWHLTIAPHAIRNEWILGLGDAGIDPATYIEVVGVVARLRAVDTLCFALGADLVELPPGSDRAPTGATDPDAVRQGGWLPTVGPASAPNALSAVPGEYRAMHDVHGVLYLSVAGMGDLDADRGLHRTQMELVAARTSLLNECFF